MSATPLSTGSPQDEQALAVLTLRAAEQDVLVVVGEADMSTAPALHDRLVQLLAGQRRPVVVELGALVFCDLDGLAALRGAARVAEAAGCTLTFRGQSAQLRWLERTFPDLPADRPDRARASVPTAPAPRAPAPPDPGLPA